MSSEIAKQLPDELVEKFIVVGGSKEFVEAIDEYRKAGAKFVIFWDIVGDSIYNSLDKGVANLRAFSEGIIPYFRRT